MHGRANRRYRSLRSLPLEGQLNAWIRRGSESLENIFSRDMIWELWLWTNPGRALDECRVREQHLRVMYSNDS